MRSRAAALVLFGLTVATGSAAPPEPDSYNAHVRYDIFAYGSERIARHRDMLKTLADAGFRRDEDDPAHDDLPDNPKATRLRGSIPAKKIDEVLKKRHVRSLLLVPSAAKLPEKGRVRVDLRLSSGYTTEQQRSLTRQTAEVLTKDAGFVEAVGYDRRGDARLVGSVPVENMDRLVEDVRELPSAVNLPPPIRRVSPIRVAFARPDLPVPSGRVSAEAPKDAKLASDAPTRLEVILGWTPRSDDKSWQRLVESSGAVVEGRVGPLVTVLGVPKEILPKLTAMNEVAHVRLPRPADRAAGVVEAPSSWKPMRPTGTGRIMTAARFVVVADDFAGWEKLPGAVSLLDLTAERNRSLLPDPAASAEGHGTRCARSLLGVSPEAEVTLVRIDAAAPYMLETIARAINGEPIRTINLDRRLAELRYDQDRHDRERDPLNAERRRVLDYPVADEESEKAMAEYRKKRDAFEKDEKELAERRKRYFALLRDLQKLRGVRVVAAALTWPDGYPLDGSFVRTFDDRPFRAAMWFVPSDGAAGSAWSGPFRDGDGNGVMEFVTHKPKETLPPGSWSPEVNFLQWRSANGATTRDLPAGAKVRVSLQWSEAHDPLPLRVGEDVYREPLSKFGVVIVRQLDPDGKSRPEDDLDIVATSAGPPTRLTQSSNSAVYEYVVDLEVKSAGRYAVFVEGRTPQSRQAEGENVLPSARKPGEVRPRLFARTLAGDGRAAWGFANAPLAP